MYLWRCSCNNYYVSLFTGERIEIGVNSGFSVNGGVSLFTGEWIEIRLRLLQTSLCSVSLFMGEWIEKADCNRFSRSAFVSLFTGEWIENDNVFPCATIAFTSPSLRGSGLKSYLDTMAKTQGVSLLQKNELTETNIIF